MIITINDYLSSSGKYKSRTRDPDCTQLVKDNAEKLLMAVNGLLSELGITTVTVSSGFRPSSVNGKIKNAAKASLHMSGRAIDLVDVDGKLDALVGSRDDLLKKYGLWQEHPDATPGWFHCDNKERSKRPKNRFVP